VAGRPCLRVVYRLRGARRRYLHMTEWLRAEGDRIVCVRRRLGHETYDLEPPQPVLALPLEPGQGWTWEGRAGEHRARLAARVVAREGDETLEVEQETTVGERTSARRQVFRAGAGLVAEEATFFLGDWADREDLLVSERVEDEP